MSSDARLAAIVESSFDAIISKNLDGTITSWNPAAERLFGYSPQEAIGRSILMLIPPGSRDEEDRIISRIKRGERIESYETVRLRKDGSLVPISITVSPIRGVDGVIVGASKIARDITYARESERRIRDLLREVNHRVKNQFAVILSMIRETGKRSLDPAEFQTHVRERITALAMSHDLLVAADWSGADLATLAREQLRAFGHEDRVEIVGPAVELAPNAVQNLGMAFHELGTNSAKYGALSSGSGHIRLFWSISPDTDGGRLFQLTWEEELPARPEVAGRSEGFGSIVLKRVAPQSLSGTATLERAPGRVFWSLSTAAENVET
ncbi:MAG: PAS domain S-box protein [Rhizobiaceae bacterium]